MRIPLGLRAAAGAITGGGGGGGGGNAWNISTATFNGSPINFFHVGDKEANARGVFFKSDGTKMYVTGSSSDDVVEYTLSTAWRVGTATYVQELNVGGNPTSLFFRSDGVKMYVLANGTDVVQEFDLSTAWDVSTASLLQSFSVAAQESQVQGLFFKSDGTKMYVTGTFGDDVNEYNLSTAWDVSTASYLQTFSVSPQDTNPNEVVFKSDGTKMYIAGDSGENINEYSLSTAWDVSTASFTQNQSMRNWNNTDFNGLAFKSDGTKLYTLGIDYNNVFEWDLSTAWDISTMSFTSPTTNFLNTNAQVGVGSGIALKADGTKLYVLDSVPDDVSEYSLSSAWDVSTGSYIQAFSVNAQETQVQGLFFKSDGTKMYVTGATGDDVNEYNLSTAWDISTASYSQNFSINAQETVPNDLTFKGDGTKMYIVGTSSDTVHEYNLSTAWDVSTASYLQGKSVSPQDGTPTDVTFKSDGTKMYITGQGSRTVYEYDLSTAWDVSTASYLQSFYVGAYCSAPTSLGFSPDGLKLVVLNYASGLVWSFDL